MDDNEDERGLLAEFQAQENNYQDDILSKEKELMRKA